jgi:hypothetical protein
MTVRLLLALLLLYLQAPPPSPFDGRWKIDLDSSPASQTSLKYAYLLQNGTYSCASCDPPVELLADGHDQPISGDPCFDTISVNVVNSLTTRETDKRKGKIVGTSMMVVSSDGHTATVEWTESCNANGDVIAGKDILSRVEKGPRGAHAISGSWRLAQRVSRSDNALIATIRLDGNTFHFSDPAGQSFAAPLDGTDTPVKGGLGNAVVSVVRIGTNTIQETEKRDSKVVTITRFTLAEDEQTMTITIEDAVSGGRRQFVARRK